MYFKILLSDRNTFKFAVGVIIGMAFSISVILSTIGIMDGFEKTLRSGLKRIAGDFSFYSRDGFFEVDKKIKNAFIKNEIKSYLEVVQSEGFALLDGKSKGILLKGVKSEQFESFTGVKLKKLKSNEIIVGKELLIFFKLKIGEELVLTFSNGNTSFESLPRLERFTIVDEVDLGIFERNLRTVFIRKDILQNFLGLDSKVNLVEVNIDDASKEVNLDIIKERVLNFEDDLGLSFRVRPYWSEYTSLLSAVKEEKFMISIVLQIIVIIAIFNALAFIVFLSEKKSQEIFLLKALGGTAKKLNAAWLCLLGVIWFLSCFCSILFVKAFDMILRNASFFKLPGDIYTLGSLELKIQTQSYIMVFSIAFILLFFIASLVSYKLSRKPILYGLRKEFT